jgi:transposase-like protein
MIVCPVCQSPEIYAIVGGYIGQLYRCKSCGYRGSFVLEIDKPEEKDRTEKPDDTA